MRIDEMYKLDCKLLVDSVHKAALKYNELEMVERTKSGGELWADEINRHAKLLYTLEDLMKHLFEMEIN